MGSGFLTTSSSDEESLLVSEDVAKKC